MKKQDKQKMKNTAKVIIQAVGLTAVVAGVMVFPGLAYVVKWVEGITRDNSPKTRRSFQRLQKRGMVILKKENNKLKLFLTKKGRRQFVKYQLEDLPKYNPDKWDGKWRFVMFDIPESVRYERDRIRQKLYKTGFVPIQKSVFIYPYPCKRVVEFLREFYSLEEGQLYIFEGMVLEGEKALLKHFHLKPARH